MFVGFEATPPADVCTDAAADDEPVVSNLAPPPPPPAVVASASSTAPSFAGSESGALVVSTFVVFSALRSTTFPCLSLITNVCFGRIGSGGDGSAVAAGVLSIADFVGFAASVVEAAFVVLVVPDDTGPETPPEVLLPPVEVTLLLPLLLCDGGC